MAKAKMRFPDSVISAALKAIKTIDDRHPRAVARDKGANLARQWVCWLYGAVEYAPQVNFFFELPGGHKPTKLAFVQLLEQAVAGFEQHYGFDSGNGYAQVNGKDIAVNVAYGFYDELNTLAERFDLWRVLDQDPEPEPNPSKLFVRKSDASLDGGCNFCPNRGTNYEVGSEIRTVRIRMCPQCVKAFRAQTKNV